MSIIATSMRTVTTSSGTLAIQRRRVNARIVRARAARCQAAARRLTSCAKRRGIDAAGARQARGGAMVRVVAVGVALVVSLLAAGSGTPVLAQAKPQKLDFAYILAPPESGAVAFMWMAEEVTRRSHATLTVVFHGGTLLNKELEIMDAVKSGNVAIGSPSGAASTVFPELGVFLVPYLVRDYAHAYKMFNGEIGRNLDEQFQRKYRLKILLFFDYGFRHFWNNKRPIARPDDLKGLKLRVQQGKGFADTVNGLGANAVPMSWSEVVPAAQQCVIDGADLPIVNINALKIYEVSMYASMTFHNYRPSLVVIHLDSWDSLVADAQRQLAV